MTFQTFPTEHTVIFRLDDVSIEIPHGAPNEQVARALILLGKEYLDKVENDKTRL